MKADGPRQHEAEIGFAYDAIARSRRCIHRRFPIDPLTPEDTADYLRARLARAGCTRDVFASDAVTLLHEAAGGALRDRDRLATSCLRIATRKKRKSSERDVVSRVVKSSAVEAH